MKKNLLIISCLIIGTLNAQVEVQYFENTERAFHLNLINEKPYYGNNISRFNFDIVPNKSHIYSFNGMDLTKEITLDNVNDSLDNAYLFDLWENSDNMIIFSLSISNQTNQKYFTALEYDIGLKNLISVELFPVENMRTFFGYKKVKIDNKTRWYFLEFDEISNEEKGIVRVSHEDGKVNWARSIFDDGITGRRLDDIFLDENKEILVLNTPDNYRKFFVFDTELNFKFSGFQNSEFQGISYANPTTFILGGEQGNYTLLERFFYDDGFILLKREMVLNSDNIWISDEYAFLFPEDNSYFIQKYQKNDYTIFHYSKSSLDLSSDSFGYRIIFFDKFGNLENQIEVHEETSVVLGFVDFYKNNTIAYGMGEWLNPGFTDPFIIKLTLSDTTTSTEDIWQEATPSILLSNLIVDSKLRFIDNEIDLNRITVYDISGRQLISGPSVDGDISFLPVGHYVLRYDSANGVLTERFVKVE